MSARAWLAGMLALVWLHLFANIRWPFEALTHAQAWLLPNPDLALLLACGIAAVLAGLRPGRIAWPLSAALLLIPLWRFGATLVPAVYGKPFDPWDDVLLIPGLVHLLTHDLGLAQFALYVVLGCGVAGVLWWLLQRALRRVLDCARSPQFGLPLLVALQLLLLGGWYAESCGAAAPWRRGSIASVLREGLRFVRTDQGRAGERFREQALAAQQEHAASPQDLGRLGGADLHLLFVESYGRVLHREPVRDTVGAWYTELDAQLRTAGLQVVSAYVRPSVRGGGSALAHAELLSGVPVGTFRELDWLLGTGLVPLPKILQQLGYHTIDVQPGMPRPWPEGMQFFGFAQEKFAADLGYRGTRYHWGEMPDQYALARLLVEDIAPAKQPVFAQFVSVTSHAPYTRIPPYVADWTAAADSAAFAGPPAQDYGIDWLQFTHDPRVEEAYLNSIQYSLQTACGFAAALPRRALVLVAGDHQPPATGSLTGSDTSFDVPIHAISSDPALLAPLRDQGWSEGFLPPAAAASFSSARFLPRFLDWYSGR